MMTASHGEEKPKMLAPLHGRSYCRSMTSEITLTGTAADLFETIRDLPIVSPHGHTDPRWFAEDAPFADPAELIIIPDHYVFRMLYSQGVALEDLGVGVPTEQRDPRAIWHLFAQHWHLFLGTPTRLWLSHMFRHGFGIEQELTPQTADTLYDQIDAALKDAAFRPRALFDSFGLELLATTDAATDPLNHHQTIRASWDRKVIPTFRPDAVIDPADPRYIGELAALEAITDTAITTFEHYLTALRSRRAAFKALGATATDHAIEDLHTEWLDRTTAEDLFSKARQSGLKSSDAKSLHGHMLVEMAQMSAEDGLVMQIHAGSRRNTNHALLDNHGRDMGADMPIRTNWVYGLEALLNRVGTNPAFGLIAFTLDESTYARELAPMAGHWPCLKIGPPWWFHDSLNGILRYFDQVVETGVGPSHFISPSRSSEGFSIAWTPKPWRKTSPWASPAAPTGCKRCRVSFTSAPAIFTAPIWLSTPQTRATAGRSLASPSAPPR